LVRKPVGKRPTGTPKRRWEDFVKVGLSNIGHGGQEWLEICQNRVQWRILVLAALNLLCYDIVSLR
jgi:hypothetical protein